MSAPWTEMTLADIAIHKPGKQLKREIYSSGGPYSVFGSNSIMGSHTCYSHEGPLIVLARIGSNCGAIRFSREPCWINNNATGISAKPGVSAEWLYYKLSTMDMKPHRAGTGQPFIHMGSLMGTKVNVPRLDEQQRIAAVLATLDERIESLRRQASLLADTGEALLELETTQQGAVVSYKTIEELGPLIYGKALSASMRREGQTPVVSSSGISGAHDVALVHEKGVIVGRKGNVGSIFYSNEPFWPIDTTYYITDKGVCDLRWLALALSRTDLKSMNSDSAVPGLNRNQAHKVLVPVPPMEVQERVADMLHASDAKLRDIKKLSEVRDFLVPRLISGILKVDSVDLSADTLGSVK